MFSAKLFATIGLSALFVQVSGSSLGHTARSLLNARQLENLNIPEGCESACQPVVNEISACLSATDPTCPCTNEFMNHFKDCAQCGIDNGASQETIQEAQTAINQVTSACNEAGSPVEEVNLEPKPEENPEGDNPSEGSEGGSNEDNGAIRAGSAGLLVVAGILGAVAVL